MAENKKIDIFTMNALTLDKNKLLSCLKDSSKTVDVKIQQIEASNLEQQIQQYGKDRICPVCQDEQITVPQLHKHIIRNHPPKAFQMKLAKFLCNFCKNMCFQKKKRLQNHIFKCNQQFASLKAEEQQQLLLACQWQDD